MEFKQLMSYTAVVRDRSFTKAAEKLFLSQPTISAHIQALEEEAGTKLILRTTKSLEITEAGKRYYDYAMNILALRERMLESCASGATANIRIGASTIPSGYVLPEIIAEYRKMHPSVSFTVTQSDSHGVIDGLADGLYDLGFVGMSLRREGLRFVPFCRDEMVIITPPAPEFSALKDEESPSLATLLSGPVILREEGSGSGDRLLSLLNESGLGESDLKVTARVNDQEAIRNMVAAGLGTACISRRAAVDAAGEGKILIFDLPERAAERTLYLVFREGHTVKDHVRDFADYLEQMAEQ